MPGVTGDLEVVIHPSLIGHEDSSILRYMSFGQFRALLSSGLHLTRADDFTKDDPFEGEFADSIYNIAERLKILKDGKNTRMSDSLKMDAKDIRALSYVSCWTLSECENVALWKLYGNIAIKTTVIKLKQAIEGFLATSRENESILMKFLKKEILKVKYIDHRSTSEEILRDMFKTRPRSKLLQYKNVGYEYEGEVRIIFDGAEQGTEAVAKRLGERCVVGVVPQDFVLEILVSPFADNSFFNRVKNEMEIHGPEIHGLAKLVDWSALKFAPGTQESQMSA